MNKLKWVSLALLLGFSLIVVFQNLAMTEVRLLFSSFYMSKATLLLLMLLVGFLLGISTPTLWRFATWRAELKKSKQTTARDAD